MITANLALTWERFRAAQVRLLVLMKHAQIVITNQAASPAMTGTLLLKPAQLSAQVLISIPAPVELMSPAAAVRRVMASIISALVPPHIHGKVALAFVVLDINIPAREQTKPVGVEQRVMASIINALVPPHIHGKVALALVIQHTNMLVHQEI